MAVSRKLLVIPPVVLVLLAAVAVGLSATDVLPCDYRTPGASKDECLFDRAMARPPEDIRGVWMDAKAIGDPMVRQAAVMGWIRTWRGRYYATSAIELCGLVEGAGQDACVRYVGSPHLQHENAPR
ncbi:MAG: hypothetical protein H6742_01525 [Alphaproteobacteria bacterium]|nr:hypothetical protein [Alphaproteobacteria bacterium]